MLPAGLPREPFANVWDVQSTDKLERTDGCRDMTVEEL